MSVDTDDELVFAKRWDGQTWQVRSKAYVLVIADSNARRPSNVESQPRMQRLCRVWASLHMDWLAVFTNEFDFDHMLLIRLTPWDSDHDPYAQIDNVWRTSARSHEGGVDPTSRQIQEVVHGFSVVAEDSVDLHVCSGGVTIELFDGMTVACGRDDRQGR